MTAPIYGISAPANVSLGAATAVTALAVKSGAAFGLQLHGFDLGNLGVTASDVPILVELAHCTFAGAGTSTGAATITQESGRTFSAAGFTAFYDYTAEPTVLTVFRSFTLTPNGGLILFDYPLGTEPDTGFDTGFALRLTAPAALNVRPSMRVSRI